ncbi:MAG: hypothetical protein FWD96_02840 [Defluviitaleaceae bacterium]|nr:hypothetical protein [Defluviitaleaceae bacterium]
MKKRGNVIVETTQIKLVVCNMCGLDIDIMSNPYVDNHISIEKIWNYGSPYDGEQHNIDLCAACYDELLGRLKVAPNL